MSVGDRLFRWRRLAIERNSLQYTLFVGRYRLVLQQNPDGDLIAPFERLLDKSVELLRDFGVAHPRLNERVIALLFQLVDTRNGPSRLRVLAVFATVPFARVNVVVRRTRLQDVYKRRAVVRNRLLNNAH